MDSSCKQRAYCLYRSFVIVHTERGQWEASFTREKSACLAEVSVTEQILWKFPDIMGELSMHKQCVPGSFSPPTHEAGNEAKLRYNVEGNKDFLVPTWLLVCSS